MAQQNKICQVCGEAGHSKFYCRTRRQMITNPLMESNGYKPRTGSVVPCAKCGKDVYRHPSRIGRIYCGSVCSNFSKRKSETSKCVLCHKEYYVNEYQIKYRGRKYCSSECKNEAMKTKRIGKPMKRTGVLHRLQSTANRYARLRDCGGVDGYANCISCGILKHYSELDGGHFIPTTTSSIRFDERNINAQCIKCNRYLSGNGRHYLRGMIAKYGEDVTAELESMEHVSRKWSLEELVDLETYYKEKIKALSDSPSILEQ